MREAEAELRAILANTFAMRGAESVGLTSLPTGTVTFLISDIQASTAAWDRHPEAMKTAMAGPRSRSIERLDAGR